MRKSVDVYCSTMVVVSIASDSRAIFRSAATLLCVCCFLTLDCLALPAAKGTECSVPAALQAKVHHHPSAAAFAEIGEWFATRKQFSCAANAYQQAVAVRPDSAQLNNLLGVNLDAAGNAVAAIGPLQESIRIDPKNLDFHLALATALDHAHRTAAAETEWRSALAVAPQSSAALDGLAGELIAEKDFSAAIALLGSSPLTPERSVTLALAYTRSGRLQDAAQVLRKAHAADPASLPVSNALAGVLVMESRKQEAEDILLASMKVYPADLKVKTLYLRMLVMNDDPDKARPLGAELLAAAPQSWEVQYLNGVLERRDGDYAQARLRFQQAIKLDPGNVEARENLGGVLARLKDAPAAKVELEKAIELGSDDPEVRFELASVLRTLGENEEADKQFKIYQEQAQKKSNLTQAGAKAAFGDEKLAAGQPLVAAQLYREALSYAPNEASLAYKLAMALDKAGDPDAERGALQQAIAIDPGMAEAQNQLGYLASRAQDTAGAEEYFRRAVRASPGYVKAWINLSAVLLLESRLPEAQEALRNALRLDPANLQAQNLSAKLNELQSQQR